MLFLLKKYFLIFVYLLFFVNIVESNENQDANFLKNQNKLPESRLLINENQDKTKLKREKKENFSNKKSNKDKNIKILKREKENFSNKKSNKDKNIKILKREKENIILFINFPPESEQPYSKDLNNFLNSLDKLSTYNSIVIKGYAEKRNNDSTSKVRRLSLKRALYLRSLLLKNNFKISKIYVKALGHNTTLEGNKDFVVVSSN